MDFHSRAFRASCCVVPSRSPEGIVIRHRRNCPSLEGQAACGCAPGYQAQVFSARDQRTIRKTFESLGDARAWRAEANQALRHGTMRAPSKTTLAEAAAEWLEAAKAGVIRTKAGHPYKPSALRGYEDALRLKVLPELGHLRLSSVTRNSIQDLVDRLLAQGLSPSTTRNAILPLRAIYRRLLSRSEVLINPTLASIFPPKEADATGLPIPLKPRSF
jgi:integrase